MTCYGSVKVKDGAGNQSRARCAGSAVDWCFSKNEKLLYRRADSTFPTFALIAHYIVASERGIEALRATIIFSMWSIIPYFVYLVSLWYFTGMMRLPAAFVGSVACWGISAWVLIICWIKLH